MKAASGNKFWVPALMIASVVLLTAFVSQWLAGQYREAEKSVEKDVRADLRKTSDQLLDSLLSEFISIPLSVSNSDTVIVNRTGSIPRIRLRGDSVPKKQTVVNISMSSKTGLVTERLETSHEIRTVLPHQPGDTHSKKMVMITASDTSIGGHGDVSDLLTKGIGVFIKKMAGSGTGNDILSLTNQPLDTALCKRLLQRNWQNQGLDYELTFLPKNGQAQHEELLFANNPLFPQRIAVSLPNRRSYLLGSLLPQFSFGFFLLLVTTLAFWLTYRSLRKQRQLYELRTDFVNNISHELKTPVSTVKVAVEALQQFNRRQEPEVMDEYLQLMKLEMNRLDKLINQVLTSAMMDESTTFLQTAPTDLVPLVNSVIEGFQWQLNHSGAKVEFHPSADSAIILGDQTHIEGVLLNLLDNCLKYGGKHPAVRIGLFVSAKTVEVTVADEGPGIPAGYLGQLFDKFFRVPTGNEHNVKGYGLGLSYCKQVMDHHKGTITAENLPEKGCLFRLTFPLFVPAK